MNDVHYDRLGYRVAILPSEDASKRMVVLATDH